MYHCAELCKFGGKVFAVEANVSGAIACKIAIVGCAEDGDAFSIVSDFVSFLFDLMRTNQQA